jgi:tetratricopeptide (TPR) repeat protein
VKWCERAIREAEIADEREALAHAHRLLGWAKAELGVVDAEGHLRAALHIYEELGDLSGLSTVLNNLGMDAYFSGRWDEARDLYDRSRDARRKTGDEVNAAHGTNNIAEILSDQGHLEDAEQQFRDALRIWRAARFRLGIAFATANLGRVAARGGRYEEAERLYDDAIAEFRAIGAEGQALETEARVAENLLLSGRVEAAERLTRQLLDRAVSTGGMATVRAMLYRILGYAVMRRDAAAALDAFEQSLRIGEEADAQYEMALTLEAQATLARHADEAASERLASQAQAILRRLGVVSTPRVGTLTGHSA